MTFYEAATLAAGDELRARLEADDRGDDVVCDPTKQARTELAAATAETKHRIGCRLQLARHLRANLPQLWTLVAGGRLDVFRASEVVAHELVELVVKSLVPAILDEFVAELEATTPSDACRGDGPGLVGVNPTPPAS